MTGAFRIAPLDHGEMLRWIGALVSLDTRLFESMGSAYAEASWGAENFLSEREGKWEWSLAAIQGTGRLVGFCIASAPRAGAVHVHRLAVAPEHQRHGVARLLLSRLEQMCWLAADRTEITIAASAGSPAAAAIYNHLGFEALCGGDLSRYAAGLGREVRVAEDHLEELHGQRYRVFRKALAGEPGPGLSIVFLTFNSLRVLETALATFYRRAGELRGGVEVIVVDNHSEDGTEAMVRARFPAARYERTERNLGSSAGRNVGIRLARGQFIALLDSDTFIEAPAVEAMREFLVAHREFAAVSCKLTFADGRHHPTHSVFPSPASELFTALYLHKLVPDRIAERYTLYRWRYTEDREVDWVGLGCSVVRRLAMQGVGPLDERFFYTGEDVDWCYRARQVGWKVGIVASAQAVHVGGQGIKRNIAAIFDKPFRGKLRFFEKHFGPRSLPFVRAIAVLDALSSLLIWGGIFCLLPGRRERARSFLLERYLLLRAMASGKI